MSAKSCGLLNDRASSSVDALLSLNHGYAKPRKAQRDYVASARQKHVAGTHRASAGSWSRLSISPSPGQIAWTARSGLPAASQSHLRAWVLLARPRRMSKGPTAEIAQGLLERKIQSQQATRRTQRCRHSRAWLEV